MINELSPAIQSLVKLAGSYPILVILVILFLLGFVRKIKRLASIAAVCMLLWLIANHIGVELLI